MELVRLLITKGAHVSVTTSRGSSPLHIAARKGLKLMVRLLLDFGADVNCVNRSMLLLASALFNYSVYLFGKINKPRWNWQ